MRDTRYWPEQDLINFIETYKSFPCLWKIKSKEYSNKQLKHRAYEKLVELCKNTVYPEANRDFVTKKIQSLRGTFRKELKKVMDSKTSGVPEEDVYKPNLWYFNLLLFTQSQDETSNSINDIKNQIDVDDVVEFDDVDTWSNTPEFVNENTQTEENIIEPQDNQMVQLQQSDGAVNVESPCNPLCTGTKRKITDGNLLCNQECQHRKENSNTDLDEFDAVGISIGKKLRRMDPLQAIYAEALINKVITKGLLKNLSENTDVYENVQYYGHHNPQISNFSPSPAPSSSHGRHFSQFHQKSQDNLTQKEYEN